MIMGTCSHPGKKYRKTADRKPAGRKPSKIAFNIGHKTATALTGFHIVPCSYAILAKKHIIAALKYALTIAPKTNIKFIMSTS